jgi:hypothetical protein
MCVSPLLLLLLLLHCALGQKRKVPHFWQKI